MLDAVIGLDIGTTCAKALLYDQSGAERANVEQAYTVNTPQPGWVEQSPHAVWAATVHVLREVAACAGAALHIRALAVASQSGSLLPVRVDGTPVYEFITWMDGRSEPLVNEWVSRGLDRTVRRISGWQVHPGLPLVTLAWLRAHCPDIFSRAERYLCVYDFVVHRLTGLFYTNPSSGSVTQLMAYDSAGWSSELCALAGVSPQQLSQVQPSGHVIGSITPAISALTGLPLDTLVVNGGHDQSCTALAVGIMQPGQMLLAGGTSWVTTGVVAGYTTSPDVAAVPAAFDLSFHAAPGRWTVSQSLGGLGASLEWLVGQCWQHLASRVERFDLLNRELSQTQPGCDGLVFLPMSGGHAAPAGLQRGGFANLQLGHTRAHLARAVMESAAFELRITLEHARQAGMAVQQLWLVGGATRSTVWPGIVADVTGVPLSVTDCAHLPAVGAAMLAGWGAGVFTTLAEAQAGFERPVRMVSPDESRRMRYDEAVTCYRRIAHQIGAGDRDE